MKKNYGHKKINPILRCKIQLEDHDLWRYSIKKLRTQVLEVSFEHISSDEESFKNLARVMRTSTKTQKLVISNPKSCEITKQDKALLSENIKRLGSLRSINMNLGADENEMNSTDLETFWHALKARKHLENLHWDFGLVCEVTNTTMKRLGRVLKGLVFLEKIRLVFDVQNKITDGKMQKLGQAVQRVRKLENIILGFEG